MRNEGEIGGGDNIATYGTGMVNDELLLELGLELGGEELWGSGVLQGLFVAGEFVGEFVAVGGGWGVGNVGVGVGDEYVAVVLHDVLGGNELVEPEGVFVW